MYIKTCSYYSYNSQITQQIYMLLLNLLIFFLLLCLTSFHYFEEKTKVTNCNLEGDHLIFIEGSNP